ncbi:hypothetical protein NDU88_001733 [Pleurodeles waltl]|uniref:Core shell protein Gag P30 domain-containing protein n=1 Tax=Pleurodeles waltl TaxID=8319 RepID=A0AAV7SBP1_PLEWA|nr:hypothetical protein NDU88_001733 [Pleurodeles waltl]
MILLPRTPADQAVGSWSPRKRRRGCGEQRGEKQNGARRRNRAAGERMGRAPDPKMAAAIAGDLEYKKYLQDPLDGYFHINWGTAGTRGSEWEALKVVIRGESLSKTYGIRQRLDRQLTQQEEVLAAIQCQVDSGGASEADCLEVRGRIVDLWDRLDNYVRWNYRQ